jgi:GTP cyclohydrolase I
MFVPVHYVAENYKDIIFVKDVSFSSLCEHHLLPFFGKIHIACIPRKNKIIGISEFINFIEVFASRLQL